MATYPRYDIHDTKTKGPKVTVYLRADTRCGPRIKANATARTRADTPDEYKSAYQAALRAAVRNLGYEHDNVVRTCNAKGKHANHR
jgi:hypothetical protein